MNKLGVDQTSPDFSENSLNVTFEDGQIRTEAVERVMSSSKGYYDILRVCRKATIMEIERAYRAIALQIHPDKNKHPKAVEAFEILTKAKEVLIDPERRASYDMSLADETRIEDIKCEIRPCRPNSPTQSGYDCKMQNRFFPEKEYENKEVVRKSKTFCFLQVLRSLPGEYIVMLFIIGMVFFLVYLCYVRTKPYAFLPISTRPEFALSENMYSLDKDSDHPEMHVTRNHAFTYFLAKNSRLASWRALENLVEKEYIRRKKISKEQERSKQKEGT